MAGRYATVACAVFPVGSAHVLPNLARLVFFSLPLPGRSVVLLTFALRIACIECFINHTTVGERRTIPLHKQFSRKCCRQTTYARFSHSATQIPLQASTLCI